MGFGNFQWSSSTPSPTEQGPSPQYRFLPPTNPGAYLNIKLDGMGPKLLVSDLSTADQPVLRWRLAVRGNTAVEFGVVPLNMVVSGPEVSVWFGRRLCLSTADGCIAKEATAALAASRTVCSKLLQGNMWCYGI